MNRPSSARKVAANCANAQKSTGPKTEEGKARSRQNARKHGQTGTRVTLPNEEAADFDRRLETWTADLGARGAPERYLVERAVMSSWKLDRSDSSESATLAEKVRQAQGQWELKQQGAVFALGRRLLEDPIHRTGTLDVDRNHPKVIAWQVDEPALIVAELTLSYHGCAWLLERWDELADILEEEGYWHYDAKFKAIRMLGKRPEAVLYDRQVAEIMLTCHVAHPEPWAWLQEVLQTAVGTENRPMYARRVEALKAHLPGDVAEARVFLAALVDEERARLYERMTRLEPSAAIAREEAERRASFDDSRAGELRRRYHSAAERELHRALTDLLKLQRARLDAEEAGRDVAEPESEPEVVTSERETSEDPGPSTEARNEPSRQTPTPEGRPKSARPWSVGARDETDSAPSGP